MRIPTQGLAPDVLLENMRRAKSDDVDWHSGRSWSLVYYGGDEHTDFLKSVYNLYFSENGAGPSLFPSLRRMEAEVVSMVLDLVDGDSNACGTMTSGGTESILLAIKAYRDQARARNPQLKAPEMLVPQSAHPAFLKAAQYFDVAVVPVPLNSAYECDVEQLRHLVSERTICVVASAPSFPHGVMDPIPAMAEIAQQANIGLHVDACLGGLILPFVKKIGFPVPAFGFDIPGVSSISTDLHKNGYTAKGASAILYRNLELRRYQFFVSADWPGGLQASPTMLGTRPGGAIAAAWAALMVLGEEGYLDIARRTMDTTQKLMNGLRQIETLSIVGCPVMSVFGFESSVLNIFALGDRIDAMGWRINRQNHPPSLHVVVTPNHAQIANEFIADIKTAVTAEIESPTPASASNSAILYGGTEDLDQVDDATVSMIARIEAQYLP